jgi:hypothetical protein
LAGVRTPARKRHHEHCNITTTRDRQRDTWRTTHSTTRGRRARDRFSRRRHQSVKPSHDSPGSALRTGRATDAHRASPCRASRADLAVLHRGRALTPQQLQRTLAERGTELADFCVIVQAGSAERHSRCAARPVRAANKTTSQSRVLQDAMTAQAKNPRRATRYGVHTQCAARSAQWRNTHIGAMVRAK